MPTNFCPECELEMRGTGPICDFCQKANDLRAQYRAEDKPPLKQQVGGDHYKKAAIQPVEFIHKNRIGYMEGCAIKYLFRWREKGGIEDLKKARHFIDLLIEMETTKEPA